MNLDYFDALVADRTESANVLEKPSMNGVKDSVVDKYSEQAHFVYELLQNADDAQAKHARFKLYHDRLIFAHDGTRLFSVSNPKTEKEDKENGILGDVNSILSIGNSTKTGQNKIGKFGVGFMEELADIPLILEFENETKKLPIEVISIKSYTLRVKLKPNADISVIQFDLVKEARITAQNPVFLLEE